MRASLSWVTFLLLFVLGCDGAPRSAPTAPSSVPTRALPYFSEQYTAVALGQIVRSEIGTADILCDSPDFYCRYYRVTVPQDGTLDVGMTHTPGRIYSLPQAPIDMWITLPYGRRLWMEGYRGPNVVAYAHAPVAAGETLEIGVVSYEVPGVTFELTFSLAR